MPITANTTRPIRFYRRLSGQMEPPIYEFRVGDTSATYRKGHVVEIDSAGRVRIAAGAFGTGVDIANTASMGDHGIVGIFYGTAADAPVLPSAAGVQGVYVSPAALTAATTFEVPGTERISLVLTLPDCIFIGHETNGDTDITAPTISFAEATGGLLEPCGISQITPTGENMRFCVDTSVSELAGGVENIAALPIAFAYPQIPSARGTAGAPDPYRMVLAASGTSNPAVEFVFRQTIWSHSGATT